MMMPSIFGENLFNDWFDFSFPGTDRKSFARATDLIMKTDVKEKENGYEVEIDLPGFKKEDIKAELKEGYLTISAARNTSSEEKKEGKYIRKERFAGNVSRSFYVGKGITQDDIRAKFENGILTLDIPKVNEKQVEENRYVTIEG